MLGGEKCYEPIHKILKKASNFDWTNINKFEEFDKVYVRILNILKKLK